MLSESRADRARAMRAGRRAGGPHSARLVLTKVLMAVRTMEERTSKGIWGWGRPTRGCKRKSAAYKWSVGARTYDATTRPTEASAPLRMHLGEVLRSSPEWTATGTPRLELCTADGNEGWRMARLEVQLLCYKMRDSDVD